MRVDDYRFVFSVGGINIATLPARDCADDVTALELAQALMKEAAVAICAGERHVARVGCDGNSVPPPRIADQASSNHFALNVSVVSKT